VNSPGKLTRRSTPFPPLKEQITAKAAAVASRFFGELPGLITTFLVNLLLVPFIAYFMIRDGKALKRNIVELVPTVILK